MSSTVICDTNLLVSAAIFPTSTPFRAYQKAASNNRLVISTQTLAELFDVLNRPKFDKYVELTSRLRFFEAYRQRALLIEINHDVHDCRDPKDNKFLNLALSAPAHYIISGDADLLVLHPYHRISILSPAEFLK